MLEHCAVPGAAGSEKSPRHRYFLLSELIGLLLPCNVVVRALDDVTTLVEAVNPELMVSLTGNPELRAVADEATTRLSPALDALDPLGLERKE